MTKRFLYIIYSVLDERQPASHSPPCPHIRSPLCRSSRLPRFNLHLPLLSLAYPPHRRLASAGDIIDIIIDMESTLSHDLFAFSSPNALHGGMHSAPNHQLAQQYDHNRHHFTHTLDTIPAQMRSGLQQSSPFAPRMPSEFSQPYASTSTSAMFGGFDVQHPSNAQLYQHSGFGDHRTHTSTISPMKLTPLSINPHSSSLQPSPTSSSPSSTSGRTQAFSRRSDGITGSPPRTGQSDVLFCRTANPHGRQRTAQACEKCRDRKTKVSSPFLCRWLRCLNISFSVFR